MIYHLVQRINRCVQTINRTGLSKIIIVTATTTPQYLGRLSFQAKYHSNITDVSQLLFALLLYNIVK